MALLSSAPPLSLCWGKSLKGYQQKSICHVFFLVSFMDSERIAVFRGDYFCCLNQIIMRPYVCRSGLSHPLDFLNLSSQLFVY